MPDGGQADASRRKTTKGPLFVHVDDGSVWTWIGFTNFFAYKLFLEGKDIDWILDEALSTGKNLIRVFGMSRWMDGGETPETQFWPQHYGDDFYNRLPAFADKLASRGLNFEFTVFADAGEIMPNPNDQQRHLDRIVAILKLEPNAFLEIANEPHVDRGVDLTKIKVKDPGDLLWAVGDYDIERIDIKQPDGSFKNDPRPPMLVGRYVTYHGARSEMWSSEAGKEGHFYYDGWDTINEAGNRSRGQACHVPCVNDEPKGAFSQPTNRWGDERYTNWHEAEDAGAGIKLSSAGITFHFENGCVSKPMDATERECAIAMSRAMAFYPASSPTEPYEHDRTPGHPLKNVPELSPGNFAAGESVSRGLYAITSQIKGGYLPQPKDGYRVVQREGHAGGMLKLEKT